jgi:hypothetical protein
MPSQPEIVDDVTVLQMDTKDSPQGRMLVRPEDGRYIYKPGKEVQPALFFTEQLSNVKDQIRNGSFADAATLYQKLKYEAESMVRYGVKALEALSKKGRVRIPHAVYEHFLYGVCPTLAQPFIDNVSRQLSKPFQVCIDDSVSVLCARQIRCKRATVVTTTSNENLEVIQTWFK